MESEEEITYDPLDNINKKLVINVKDFTEPIKPIPLPIQNNNTTSNEDFENEEKTPSYIDFEPEKKENISQEETIEEKEEKNETTNNSRIQQLEDEDIQNDNTNEDQEQENNTENKSNNLDGKKDEEDEEEDEKEDKEDEKEDKEDEEEDKEEDQEEVNENDINKLKEEQNQTLEGGGNINISEKIMPLPENIELKPINLLVPEDEELIDLEKIHEKVNVYINNTLHPDIKKYHEMFEQIYQKYYNKKFIVENTFDYLKVFKTDKGKSDKKEELLNIKKPKFDNYIKEFKMEKLRGEISNARSDLTHYYKTLLTSTKLTPEEKKDFEKQREKFINLLHQYYTYDIYHRSINNISYENKVPITYMHKIEEIPENWNSNSRIIKLEGNLYMIDKSIVDNYNNINSEQYKAYYNLIGNYQNKNKKYHQEVEKYLLLKQKIKKDENDIKKNALLQNNYINHIVLELPTF